MNPEDLKQVQWAATLASTLLSRLKRSPDLDVFDRKACELAQRELEKAEAILYGKEQESGR